MTLNEFRTLVKWFKEINVRTVKEMINFIHTVTDGTINDILNKANGCAVYQIAL